MSENTEETKPATSLAGYGCAAVLASLLMGVLLLVTTPVYLYRCFIAAILWSWFAVPLGLPPLPYWQLAGLYTAYSVVKGHKLDFKKEPAALSGFTAYVSKLMEWALANLFTGALCLAVGRFYLWLGM